MSTSIPENETAGAQPEPPDVRLNLEVDPEGHAAAMVPVRWQVSQQLIARVTARGCQDPYMLLTVRVAREITDYGDPFTVYYDSGHVVAPLKQGMAYVTFVHPGVNEVIATVVNPDNPTAEQMLHRWTRRKADKESAFDVNGKPSLPFKGLVWYGTSAPEQVTVDAAMFATERPAWQRWLVGKLFEGKARDECHFRERLSIGLLAALPLLTVGMVVRAMVMIAVLLAGMRNVNWSFLLPFNMSSQPTHEVYSQPHGSRWIRDKHNRRRPWLFWVLNPVTLIVTPAVMWLTVRYAAVDQDNHPQLPWSFGQTVLYTEAALVAATVVPLLVIVALSKMLDVIENGYDLAAKLGQRRSKSRANASEQSRRKYASVTYSSADEVADPPTLKPTLHLRYSALKARVCKPFAR